MKSTQQQVLLNNLHRALRAEEKQGFTNTGVLGGFHAFLLGISVRIMPIFPDQDVTLLKQVAQNYQHWSPLRRRESFGELMRWLEMLEGRLTEGAQLLEDKPQPVEHKPAENQVDQEYITTVSGSKVSPVEFIHALETGDGNDQNQWLSSDEEISAEKDSSRSTGGDRPTPQRTALQYVKGVGPERARLLARLGLSTVEDLLLFYPRRYEFRKHKHIAQLEHGELATVIGRVAAGHISSNSRTKVVKLTIEEGDRIVTAVWFNQTFILKQYPVGTWVAVTGKVRWQQRTPEIQVTDIEKLTSGQGGQEGKSEGQEKEEEQILPVYPETAQLSSKVIRTLVQQVLPQIGDYFPEIMPREEKRSWMERSRAHREIHFPTSSPALTQARDRLVFEEILLLQLAVAKLRRGDVQRHSPVLTQGKDLVSRFLNALPFRITKAQQRVIQEIFHDLARSITMARLVQGDVGSGKTVIAMAALLQAVGSGYQGAMMAPTEILALQHYQSLEKEFTPLGINTVLLHGNLSRSERSAILEMLGDGRAQVVVGTHALIQEEVEFKALGLAVTDEQHRFGVRQRSLLQEKGEAPHVLVMTATPIPRTLALTLYGDLQLSVLDEMPPGRQSIITRHLTEKSRPSLEKFMEDQLALGRQIYVVCPLVEESEALDTISVTERTAQLTTRFPGHRVVLLHGRMKSSEKEEVMNAFQAGDIHILVSTTVVEVGVNVPNASVMVIEGAERFGLAQLHQLRGRVGRGGEQSYCILMSDNRNSKRLAVLSQTNDGFKIAEEDLRLRGPGELFGTRQHGLAELRLADLSKDGKLVEKAYQLLQKVLENPQAYQAVWDEADRFFPPEKIGLN